ncbi:hypothetical protein PQR41_27845 [Paraburkholderia xenovorans]
MAQGLGTRFGRFVPVRFQGVQEGGVAIPLDKADEYVPIPCLARCIGEGLEKCALLIVESFIEDWPICSEQSSESAQCDEKLVKHFGVGTVLNSNRVFDAFGDQWVRVGLEVCFCQRVAAERRIWTVHDYGRSLVADISVAARTVPLVT